MKRFLIAFVVSLVGVRGGSAQDEKPQDPQKPSVAVLKFNVSDDESKNVIKVGSKETLKVDMKKQAAALYDHFVTTLVKSGRYEVIESAKVDEILKQQQLNDLNNPSDAQKLGTLLSARFLFQGSLTLVSASVTERDIPNSEQFVKRTTEALVIMDLRLLDADNGKVIMATSHKQPASISEVLQKGGSGAMDGKVNDMISKAEHELVKELVRRVIDGTFPIKVISVKEEVAYLNRGKDGGIKKGDTFSIIVRGDEIKDPDTQAVLGYEETELAVVTITSVDSNLSKGTIVWKSDKKELPKDAIAKKTGK